MAGNAEPKLRISEPYMSFYRYIDKKRHFSTKNSQENRKKPIIVKNHHEKWPNAGFLPIEPDSRSPVTLRMAQTRKEVAVPWKYPRDMGKEPPEAR